MGRGNHPARAARSLASLNGLSLVNTWQGGSDDDHQRAHFPEISFATLRNGAWHVEYDGNDVAIPDQASIRLLDGGHTDSPSSPSTPNPPAGAQPSAPTTPAPQLIAHLNANRLWYTAAILQEGDPLLLWTILAGLVDDEGRALVDIVEPTICANVGNYLAFRLSSTDLLPSPIRGSLPHGWGDPGIYAGIGSETVVVLPSPGTFVEAQLGSCSAAEKIDETVFWRWQDAPCDGSAPDITADMLASRSQDLSGTLNFVQPSLVAQPVTVPEEPAPISIGDQTLSQLTSDLHLSRPAALLDFLGTLAQVAEQARTGAGTSGSTGSRSGSSGSTGSTGSSATHGTTPGSASGSDGDASPTGTQTSPASSTTPATGQGSTPATTSPSSTPTPGASTTPTNSSSTQDTTVRQGPGHGVRVYFGRGGTTPDPPLEPSDLTRVIDALRVVPRSPTSWSTATDLATRRIQPISPRRGPAYWQRRFEGPDCRLRPGEQRRRPRYRDPRSPSRRRPTSLSR